MIRYRWLWSAALTIVAAANCAIAQPAPATVVQHRDAAPDRPELIAQPAPYVVYNTDDLDAWSFWSAAAATDGNGDSEAYFQERTLQPQPTFSRRARVVFPQPVEHEFPAPEHSRAIKLIFNSDSLGPPPIPPARAR